MHDPQAYDVVHVEVIALDAPDMVTAHEHWPEPIGTVEAREPVTIGFENVVDHGLDPAVEWRRLIRGAALATGIRGLSDSRLPEVHP